MSQQNDNAKTLPMDARKQAAIVGHLLTDKKFFEYAHSKIRPEWFNNPKHAKIYRLQLAYRNKYPGTCPTPAEIETHPDLNAEDQSEINAIKGAMRECILEVANFALQALKVELTEWMHARIYRDSVDKSVRLFNDAKYHEAYVHLQGKLKEMAESTFEDDIELKFNEPEVYLAEKETSNQGALTTGLKIFDDVMVSNGDSEGKGALLKGATTILLAPVNVGKTTTMITMAVHNIRLGKHILFMTHEGVPEDIRTQILCCFLKVDHATLMGMYKTKMGLIRLRAATDWLSSHLTYVPYNKAGMTVEEVMPIIRRRQDLLKSQLGTGAGYDMLVVDYPALLSTVQASGGRFERRNIDDLVYKSYTQLAIELKLHVLMAIQTNRQGSRDNRDANRLLTMEDVMESWGPMASATNVISINRDLMAERNNRVTFYIAKSRSARKGMAVVCKSNFAHSISHSQELGGTAYMGSDPMSDRVDNWLQAFPNQIVTEHLTR